MTNPGFIKRKKPYLIAITIAAIVMACLAWFVLIPKTAALTLPYRWNHIPVGYQRFMLHQYFGHTINGDSAYQASRTDEWIAYRTNGDYRLVVQYTKDSLSSSYEIWYRYKLGFLHKSYLLQSSSKQ